MTPLNPRCARGTPPSGFSRPSYAVIKRFHHFHAHPPERRHWNRAQGLLQQCLVGSYRFPFRTASESGGCRGELGRRLKFNQFTSWGAGGSLALLPALTLHAYLNSEHLAASVPIHPLLHPVTNHGHPLTGAAPVLSRFVGSVGSVGNWVP